MKHLLLKGQLREVGNKAKVKAVRRAGLVPCNLYGQAFPNILFSVSAKELKALTHTPNSYIVDLDLGDQKHMAVLHEVQFHPVTDEALHVDFRLVTKDKPVTLDVPIVFTGHSEGVKLGGKLLVSARKLKVSAFVDDLPDTIEVDTTELQIGKQIIAADLDLKKVNIMAPKGTVICSVRPTRATVQAAKANQ